MLNLYYKGIIRWLYSNYFNTGELKEKNIKDITRYMKKFIYKNYHQNTHKIHTKSTFSYKIGIDISFRDGTVFSE